MKKALLPFAIAIFISGFVSAGEVFKKFSAEHIKQTQIEQSITGSWEVWIPGAVTYTATETAVYQKYILGAAMNRLDIKSDGSYQWGNKKGRLIEVRPWHAQEGRRYYRISDLKGNDYDFWYDASKKQLTVLFGEVGGHAATGTRLDTANGSNQADRVSGKNSNLQKVKPAITETRKTSTVKTASAASFKPGEKVEIEWKGQWYKGTVLEAGKNTYKVNYDGWGSLYDEWVPPARIRKL